MKTAVRRRHYRIANGGRALVMTPAQRRRDQHKRNHNSVKATRLRFKRTADRAVVRERRAKLREIISSPLLKLRLRPGGPGNETASEVDQ